jgi:hypothetical protein
MHPPVRLEYTSVPRVESCDALMDFNLYLRLPCMGRPAPPHGCAQGCNIWWSNMQVSTARASGRSERARPDTGEAGGHGAHRGHRGAGLWVREAWFSSSIYCGPYGRSHAAPYTTAVHLARPADRTLRTVHGASHGSRPADTIVPHHAGRCTTVR